MNLKRSTLRPQNRRGLSSVVGALFFTILMIAGFSVLGLALDAQTDIVTTQRIVSDIEIKKQQERFGVFASTDGNNILNISINNQGQNPVEISSVWIVNKTLSDQPATRHAVTYDDAFVPTGFITNVLSTQSLEMIPDTYDIKVISTFGTIKTIEFALGSVGSSGLRAEIITDPPDVIIGQNVTIAMIVTNTGIEPINDVKPDPLVFAGTGAGSVMDYSSHIPESVTLNGGASVMFTWDYQVTGGSGDQLTFSSIARGSGEATSNMVSDISILREPTDGGSGGEEAIIIRDDLYGKPQIFLMFPGPVGWDPNDKALWGVNVANPTNQPVDVSKVVIVALSPRPTSSDKIFAPLCHTKTDNQKPETVLPTTGLWTCPDGNQLQWKNLVSPQTIAPRSVFPFLVKIGSEAIGSASGDTNNIPILVTVSSTLGQFGKAGYLTTMNKESVAMPNVYISTVPGSTNPADILGEITGITEGTTVTFNATIADMDVDTTNVINSGSRLIINIPKDWTFNGPICLTCHNGFDTPLVQTFPDGSTQIIGSLSSNLSGGSGAKTIQFTATAPNISTAKMYVMYILADGTATGTGGSNYAIGPLAETVLQVCPTSGCP